MYECLVKSQDLDIVQAALNFLFTLFLNRKDYAKAQEYLNQIPGWSFNEERFQATLYRKQGNIQEAYECHEKLIFNGYADISWALQGIYVMAMEEGDFEKARWIVGKQKSLAHLLEMGLYMEASPEWDLAVTNKDKDKALDILAEMVYGVKSIDAYKDSRLYCHMKFEKNDSDGIALMLKKAFENDTSIQFLKEDSRYQELMRELEGYENL